MPRWHLRLNQQQDTHLDPRRKRAADGHATAYREQVQVEMD